MSDLAGGPRLDVQAVFTNLTSATRGFTYLSKYGQNVGAGVANSKQFGYDIRPLLSASELAAMDADLFAGRARYILRRRFLLPFVANTTPAIAVGDLCYVASNLLLPAASITWDTNLATTQTNFAAAVAGVAVTSKSAGAAGKIVWVDISPESPYDIACSSETHEIGDLLGPAKAVGNNLVSTSLVKVSGAAGSFKALERHASAATKILVAVKSSFWAGSATGSAGPTGPTGPNGGPTGPTGPTGA